MFLTITIFIFFLIGAYMGWFAAKNGLTANNILLRYQRQIYLIGSAILGLITLIIIIMVKRKDDPGFPSFLLLYISAYFWNFILLICCFCTGFIISLEKSYWKDPQQLKRLVLFILINVICSCFLLYKNLPITNLVKSPRILDGVVLQTTPYSCAAAAIATIVHQVKPELQTTELDVVKLAGTSREGTSILGEIRAMEKLGLAPHYQRNLTIDDLVDHKQIAVLSVMEPAKKKRVLHAIALLEINAEEGTLTVGNPLYGKQVKAFKDMKDYWIREAVFVTVASSNNKI